MADWVTCIHLPIVVASRVICVVVSGRFLRPHSDSGHGHLRCLSVPVHLSVSA